MPAYRCVVVGTDGSESSYRAVERAAQLARDAGARLLLVTAYQPARPDEVAGDVDVLGAEAYKILGATPAEDALRFAADRARRGGDSAGPAPDGRPVTESLAVPGDPVDVLLQVAAERRADLVVVGNRGLRGLAGRLLGSVPADVTRRAPCDVLVVHTTDHRRP